MAKVKSIPHHPPATFTSLPKDVISHITSYLDQTSLVTFARVSRFCYQFLDDSVWRELRLVLSEHYGRLPGACGPHSGDPSEPCSVLDELEAILSSGIRDDGLEKKAKGILMSGNSRRWSKVKAVRVDPRSASSAAVTLVLDFASQTVETLSLESKRYVSYIEHYAPNPQHTFDAYTIPARFTFPSLTHLTIGPRTTCSGGIILLLCSRAPHLSSLNVEFKRYHTSADGGRPRLPFPAFTAITKLRKMRFCWESLGNHEDQEAHGTCLALIKQSPELLELNLGYVCREEGAMIELATALRDHPSLQDLHWSRDAQHILRHLQSNTAGFEKLRRMTMSFEWVSSLSVFELPCLPNCEIIHFDASACSPPRMIQADCSATSAEPMTREFASALRAMPELHAINTLREPIDSSDVDGFRRLDAFEETAGYSGRVTSIRHGNDELLCAHFLLEQIEVIEVDRPVHGASELRETTDVLACTTAAGEGRVKIFYRRPEATWQTFTDFDGEVVPREILHQMGVVEGMDDREWTGRGNVVGDATWRVLTDWMATKQ